MQGIEATIRGEIGVRSLQEHAAALRGAAEAAVAVRSGWLSETTGLD